MRQNRFKEALLNSDIFPVTWELVPGRGAKEATQEKTLTLASQAAAGGKIFALTLTDNPGGTPAMSADFMSSEIVKLDIEPLVHFTCKDKNRNAMESQLYALDRSGVRNILVMSGDYPVTGFQGRPAPVFDLDPIMFEPTLNSASIGAMGTPRDVAHVVYGLLTPSYLQATTIKVDGGHLR
jgi:methylenetetrahydrofolate reductase (NADPH)